MYLYLKQVKTYLLILLYMIYKNLGFWISGIFLNKLCFPAVNLIIARSRSTNLWGSYKLGLCVCLKYLYLMILNLYLFQFFPHKGPIEWEAFKQQNY